MINKSDITVHPHGKVRCHITYEWNPTWMIYGKEATILYWAQPCVLFATKDGKIHSIRKSELNDERFHQPIEEKGV